MNIENFDFNLCLLKILPDQLLSKFHPFLRFHCGSGLGESEYDFLSGPRQMLWHLCPTSGLLKREDMKLSDTFIKTCMQLDFWVSELIFYRQCAPLHVIWSLYKEVTNSNTSLQSNLVKRTAKDSRQTAFILAQWY